MLIALVNRSSLVSNADLEIIAAAIQIQLDLHVLPAWNMKDATIQFYADEKTIPGYAWILYIIDTDAQVEGALGFHEEVNDKTDGYIMCEPILSNGGVVMNFDASNPGQYSVSGTISHEVCEMVGDVYTNTYYDDGSGILWCGELCDPVEQVGYGITVNGQMIAVSDFLFPAFFNSQSTLPRNAPLNYLNTLVKPFSMLAGGYSIQRVGDAAQQVFARGMPTWRKKMKKTAFSRASRRNAKSDKFFANLWKWLIG